MKPRWIAYSIFVAALVALGFYRGSDRSSRKEAGATWLASIELPRNTRLETNHLQKPDLALPILAWGLPHSETLLGKYVLTHINKGQEIVTTNLAPVPQVVTQTNTTLLSFRAPDLPASAIVVNAGAKVYVCGNEPATRYGPYVVEALVGKAESATLLIRVPNDDEGTLLKIGKPELRLAALP